MSQLSVTAKQQNDFEAHLSAIRRNAGRFMAAFLAKPVKKKTTTRQNATPAQRNLGTADLRKLYRMIGGQDSVNQTVVDELAVIGRRA